MKELTKEANRGRKKAFSESDRIPNRAGMAEPEHFASEYLPPERFASLLATLSGPEQGEERSRLLTRIQKNYGNSFAEKVVKASRGEKARQKGPLDRLLDTVRQKSLQKTMDWVSLASCFADADIDSEEKSMLALAIRSAHGEAAMVQLLSLSPEGSSLHSYLVSRQDSLTDTGEGGKEAATAERLTRYLAEETGSRLGPETLKEMESLMVSRFGDVRIHADHRSAILASALGFEAFTVGHDVFFGRERYRPGTRDGKALLAHELAHVVQQQGAAGLSLDSLKGPPSGGILEKEAQRAAMAIACGLPMLVTARASSVALLGSPVVLSSQIPANRTGITNSGGHVHEGFEMNIDWDPAKGTPGHGEYRQYIKGYFKVNNVALTKPLWGGANLEEATYHEDGDGAGFRYGHRGDRDDGNDRFSNPERATGSRYRGRDDPGMRGPAGTAVDFKLTFKGQTYDTATNTHGAMNIWTVSFKGNIA